MIKSSLEVKKISVVWESEILEDPLLLLGKERGNLSSNFDGDGERIKTYAEYREWIRRYRSPLLSSPLPSLISIFKFEFEFKFQLYDIHLLNGS